MQHFTDLSHAWSKQVPQDIPFDPRLVKGGVRIQSRSKKLPRAATIQLPTYGQIPIQQKRDMDDMEQLRKMLGGLISKAGPAPNQEFKQRKNDEWDQRMSALGLKK